MSTCHILVNLGFYHEYINLDKKENQGGSIFKNFTYFDIGGSNRFLK